MKRTIALTLALAVFGGAALYVFSVYLGHTPRAAFALAAIYFVALLSAAWALIWIAQKGQA